MKKVNIYMTQDNEGRDIWVYALWIDGEYDSSETMDADTESDARAEILAAFPAAEVHVLPPKF